MLKINNHSCKQHHPPQQLQTASPSTTAANSITLHNSCKQHHPPQQLQTASPSTTAANNITLHNSCKQHHPPQHHSSNNSTDSTINCGHELGIASSNRNIFAKSSLSSCGTTATAQHNWKTKIKIQFIHKNNITQNLAKTYIYAFFPENLI